MEKYFRLFRYTTKLSLLTIQEFFTDRYQLKKFFRSNLSKQEFNEIKNILDISYLNTGFSRTILAGYAKLQNHSGKQAK